MVLLVPGQNQSLLLNVFGTDYNVTQNFLVIIFKLLCMPFYQKYNNVQ